MQAAIHDIIDRFRHVLFLHQEVNGHLSFSMKIPAGCLVLCAVQKLRKLFCGFFTVFNVCICLDASFFCHGSKQIIGIAVSILTFLYLLDKIAIVLHELMGIPFGKTLVKQ